MSKKKLTEFKAVIASPYLKDDFDRYQLTSDEGRLVIPIKSSGCLSENFYFPDEIEKLPSKGDLIFLGSTESSEKLVDRIKHRGTPIVRYSKFYNGRSGYSNRTAEDGGYSFDMPKDLKYVKALLTKDSFLEAILERDSKKVRASLESLNRTLDKPILATSFLEVALR